jgi:hypothetical protein
MALLRIINLKFGNSELNYIQIPSKISLKLYIYPQNMYQNCSSRIKTLKVHNHWYFPKNILVRKWLRTSKFKIFFISLKFQSLYNLANVFTNFLNEDIFSIVSYVFLKLNGSSKMKVWCSLWYHPIILSLLSL